MKWEKGHKSRYIYNIGKMDKEGGKIPPDSGSMRF